ncbi:MAG: hypothetical protein JSV78_06515 [Phycisphaerales bacterium]|nr:MAG: hypothetical protein JSV78_06515 [Phycisphaerales bacterium]
MKSLNAKSLVIGFLMGMCVFVLVAANPGTPETGIGRYQICTDGEEAWAIDTLTGQVVLYMVDDFFKANPKMKHARTSAWASPLKVAGP